MKARSTRVRCKRCGDVFECNASEAGNCQCAAVHLSSETLDFLSQTHWGCLCTKCLHDVESLVTSTQNEAFPNDDELKKNIHFYTENGAIVFTDRYLALRGTCCKSGCRHCPYGFKK